VTDAHQFGAVVVGALTVALVVAALWSTIDGRRTGGMRDHRFAVDRLIPAVVAAVLVNGLLGLAVAAGGGAPAEPLHLLYGPAAVVAAPLGWFLGGRPGRDGRRASRARRDAWVAVAAVVLLALELRLVATG